MTIIHATTGGSTWGYCVIATFFGNCVVIFGALRLVFRLNGLIVVNYGGYLNPGLFLIGRGLGRNAYGKRAIRN